MCASPDVICIAVSVTAYPSVDLSYLSISLPPAEDFICAWRGKYAEVQNCSIAVESRHKVCYGLDALPTKYGALTVA